MTKTYAEAVALVSNLLKDNTGFTEKDIVDTL
jgi:hypothetical protein